MKCQASPQSSLLAYPRIHSRRRSSRNSSLAAGSTDRKRWAILQSSYLIVGDRKTRRQGLKKRNDSSAVVGGSWRKPRHDAWMRLTENTVFC